MNISTSLIDAIQAEETYHRFLELDMPKDKVQELLKKAFISNQENMFKTRKARDLLTSIFFKIKNFTPHQYTKLLLYKFLPTINENEILKRQKFCTKASQINLEVNKTRELISKIITMKYEFSKKHNGTCIAIADEETYDNLRSQLAKKFYVTLIENEQDLLSVDHYEQIRFVSGSNNRLRSLAESIPQTTIITSHELIDIAPEFTTDIIDENKHALLALQELQKIYPLQLMDNISFINRTQQSFHQVEKIIQEEVNQLQATIQDAISSANFSGSNMMTIINQKKSILDQLQSEQKSKIFKQKDEIIRHIEDLTQVSCTQLISIDYLGSVSINDQELKTIEKEFIGTQQNNLFKQKIEQAKKYKDLTTKLPKIVEEVYQLDLLLTLKLFIDEYELQPPTVAKNGISFVYGKNMNIQGASPIEYYIGQHDQVAVITGANSGGKTTLLELLGQIQILTQMGLYVPAKNAKVGIIEELFYFSKNKGSLNAGAFETLLKQFSSVTQTNKQKLILADEIESVTEPDVAAKIIKGIIDHLTITSSTTLVLVTHMGRELQELDIKGRFDGIEAKGLDKDLNLVVDRNPVIGRVARSTPQLIIDRLAKLNKSEFYENLKALIS